MGKKNINIFQKSKEIEAGNDQRVSDVGFLENLKQKENLTTTPTEPPKTKTLKAKRTTATFDESYFETINDVMHTIRSSGANKLLPQGDYAFRNQDFWEQAIIALRDKTEKLYGEIKKAPNQ